MTGVLAARRGDLSKPTAAAFSPLDVSGNKGWWAASAITGKSDGDTITTWADPSVNAFDLTGTGPLYKTNIVNGQPVVRFVRVNDSAGDSLARSFTLDQPSHIFVVCKFRVSFVANQSVVFDSVSPILGRLLYRTSSTAMTMYAGGTGPVAATTPEAWHLYSCLFNGASSELRVDGGSANTGNVGATNGTGIRLGGLGDNSSYFADVDRAEVIAYSGALGSTDRGNVETYLKTKYGL